MKKYKMNRVQHRNSANTKKVQYEKKKKQKSAKSKDCNMKKFQYDRWQNQT